MPTTYAHDLFGKLVYQKQRSEIQVLIKRYESLYRIGLHGPDILFYYEPFHKNEVSSLGSRMHNEIAAPFFEKTKKHYLETGDERILVYLLGFICHYMLDSSCHPYIGKYMEKSGAGHDEIETDLDRALMEKTGKNPFHYRPGSVIKPTKENTDIISQVLDVPQKKIKKALRGMRLYTGIVVGNHLWRNTLLTGARLIHCYDFAQGRIMRRQHLICCQESTKILSEKLRSCIPETVSVLEEFLDHMEEESYINARFFRNYE